MYDDSFYQKIYDDSFNRKMYDDLFDLKTYRRKLLIFNEVLFSSKI